MDQAGPTSGDKIAAPEASSIPAEADWTGQTLGDFHVLRRLGQGGMGQVYLAEQISLKRKVALKLLRPELATNATALARFKQEAEAVAQATHPNIVQIYAIGTAAGASFMALEYVEGKNLREYLDKKGTVDLAVGLHLMAQTASALQRSSELGIIHRDIKPENILLTRKGEAKVADFGLARGFEQAVHLTQSNVTMGTPLYMSPEQIEHGPVDHRTDLYSLGVTCYHMFAGQPPFRGQTAFEVALQHVQKEPPPLAALRPDLPAELCALIHKMMAKKPADRPQTAREVLREVGRLRDQLVGQSLAGGPRLSVGLPALASDSLHGGATTLPFPTVPRRLNARYVWIGGVVLSLAAGLGLGWYSQAHAVKTVAVPPVVLPTDAEPPPSAALEREKELRRLVQEHARSETALDTKVKLKHCLDLGLFYLKERRLPEAARFFKELERGEPKLVHYRILAHLGQAMVAAFKDDPAASNKLLLRSVGEFEKIEKLLGPGALAKPAAILRKEMLANKHRDDIDAYLLLWKENPPVRAMVAEALEFNQRNAPETFPARLEPYRHPPRPTIKAVTPNTN